MSHTHCHNPQLYMMEYLTFYQNIIGSVDSYARMTEMSGGIIDSTNIVSVSWHVQCVVYTEGTGHTCFVYGRQNAT